MAREMLAQLVRDLRARPVLLGFFIGLVLAFVVRQLLQDDNGLGYIGLPILTFMSIVWVRRPIYTTIFIALLVGTCLGIALWCREECQSRWNKSLLDSGRGVIGSIVERLKH